MNKSKFSELITEKAAGLGMIFFVLMIGFVVFFHSPFNNSQVLQMSASGSSADSKPAEVAVKVDSISAKDIDNMYKQVADNEQRKIAEKEAIKQAKIEAKKKILLEKQRVEQEKLAKIEQAKAAKAAKIIAQQKADELAQEQAKEQAKEIAKKQAEQTKKLQEKKAEEEKLAKEKEAKDKAEKEKIAKEKAAQVAKEKADKAAKEKATAIAAAKAAADAKNKSALLASLNDGIATRQKANERAEAIARYSQLIKEATQNNWVIPPRLSAGLQVKLKVTSEPNGKVTSVVIVNSSGNSAFDNSAIEAVKRASPLPLPSNPEWAADFKEFDFVFSPTR